MGLLAVIVLALNTLAQSQPTDPQQLLKEADRLAWLTDWYRAMPLYAEAERVATQSGDKRNALYAKFGRLRGQMQMRSLVELSEEIANDLQSPLVAGDSRLQLRGLTVKGDIDLEWDIRLAQNDWEQVRQLAGELTDSAWEYRATGELGLIAFLGGNTGEAMNLVQQALTATTKSGDVGGEIRYVSAIANGLLLAGYAPLAMTYVDRALRIATEHPDTGFPFVIYSTKVAVLLELQRADEAERMAQTAMAEAKARDRRIKQIELSVLLAKIAQKRGQPDLVIGYLEDAVRAARAGDVKRLLADVEAELAAAHRIRGDLGVAVQHAHAAVDETVAAGSQFVLPERLRVLADIFQAQDRFQDADAAYQQATDVIEGIMVNVPSTGAQARLIGAMSEVYTGHFRLAADRLRDPAKAYAILERARGRAIADVLRTVPSRQSASPAVVAQARTISQLQVRLMRAASPTQRQRLLDQLWEAEQGSLPARAKRDIRTMARNSSVELAAVQQSLRPSEVILEYVLSEPRSYCLVIGRREVTVVTLTSRKQIEQLVDRFTTELRAGKGGQSEAAERLHAAVLAPVAAWQQAQRIIIVPDGKLHILPFDSLLTDETETKVVTIVPSASVFALLRRTPQGARPGRPLLGIGGVPYDQMFSTPAPTTVATRSDESRGLHDLARPAKLATLVSAQAEVQTAGRLLGADSVILTGEQATESVLKRQALRDFEILHFAVHGVVDPKFPERAALVLLNDPAAGEDGLLQPREISGFVLNAGVVVLSACDTAVGPTIGQEGVLNLARAFLLAGARSVVMTLWAVNDSWSLALMRRFYENIAAGQDIAAALTAAKKSTLERFGPDSAPTVAAFQIVGVGDTRIQVKNVPGNRGSDSDKQR